MIDIGLPGLRVVNCRLDGNEYVFDVECFGGPDSCTRCGAVGRLYRHGSHTTACRDRPIRGHTVKLLVRVRRYRCRVCGETFRVSLPGIRDDRHMTHRCARFIQNQCLLETFVRIANAVGCDEKTVRLLAAEHIANMDHGYLPTLPAWLGIHETHIDGAMRLVLTDIGGQKPIEILVNCDSESLAAWLLRYEDRSMVKCVAIHMWRPYRDVCDRLLPGTPIVVDRFQVVRMADYCVECARRRVVERRRVAGHVKREAATTASQSHASTSEKERSKLKMGLENEPEVAKTDRLRQALYDIYDLPKDRAAAAMDAFPAGVSPPLEGEFALLLSSMRGWRTEILAYFDFPITNAYTEIFTRAAKTFDRPGRRYNFDVFRARILFSGLGNRAFPVRVPSPTFSGSKRGIGSAYYRQHFSSENAHAAGRSGRSGNLVMVCRTCNSRGCLYPPMRQT